MGVFSSVKRRRLRALAAIFQDIGIFCAARRLMEKILQGVHEFRTQDFPKNKQFYELLATKQQKPRALFITCSDSRVLPNIITRTEPGELFQIRNAGNLIPPFGASLGGEVATIEYAVSVLAVKHIIVCGHSQCGAMKALLDGKVPDDMLGLKTWFQHAEATRKIMQIKHKQKEGLERVRAATEENVLVQLNHLSTHPCVAAGISAGTLHVYGWYYDIGTGVIKQFDQSCSAFTDLEDVAIATSPMPVRHS
jgi:carbonic anhydrase